MLGRSKLGNVENVEKDIERKKETGGMENIQASPSANGPQIEVEDDAGFGRQTLLLCTLAYTNITVYSHRRQCREPRCSKRT